MGRIWAALPDGRFMGICSGTMNGANVVLTAGHCLYDQEGVVDGTPDYFANKFPLYFIPGNGFVANGGTESEARSAPYGAWQVSRHAVPQCWASQGDSHCDVGLAILAPNGSGDAGNIVGSYRWATGYCCTVGQLIQNAGYPGDHGFADYDHGWGNAPYQCTNRLEAGSGLVGADAGSGMLQNHSCTATGGSSGGPVWTQLADGNWYLIGVNNKAYYPEGDLSRFAERNLFQPFDALMRDFYCNVIGCAAAARTSSRSRSVMTRSAAVRPAERRAAFRALGLRGDGTPKGDIPH